MEIIERTQRKFSPKIELFGWGLVWLGVALYALGYIVDAREAAFNNVLNFLYLASIGIGALFFIALEYITGAVWSVPIRRVNEFLAQLVPFAALLAVPLLFNLDNLFVWARKDIAATDALLRLKEPYLNQTFFIVRFLGTFIIWKIFIWLLTRNSMLQDATGDQRLTKINTILSAVFMPVFALTLTILAVDWGMSLEPRWSSTIYGIYFFAGTATGSLAALTLVTVSLYERGYFPKLRRDHFYNLGALLFTFVNFWAYIAFSQFMLVWYANLPEETSWFLARWHGGWEYVSIALILVQFVVPYFVLLPQEAKMNIRTLRGMAIWLLFAHVLDLYWLIMPTFSAVPPFGWMEICFPAGIAGLVIVVLGWQIRNRPLMPIGDPKLKRGLEFRL
jgi:hypothetical protein